MRFKYVGAVVSTAVMGSMLLAGCGTTSSAASTTAKTAVKGGDVLFALPPSSNLDWYLPITNSSGNTLYNDQLINQLYKSLIVIGKNYKIDWHSSIASKITYNKNGTVYHVYLNPKWHWSTGQPVNTSDVMFTWNFIKAASSSSAPAPWPYSGAGEGDIPNGVKSVVANSADEFTITLKKPTNQEWFEYNGISQLTPLPAFAWNKYPNNMTQELKYLGKEATNPSFDKIVDGPFELQSAKPSQSWTLVPNPHYDGHRSTLSKLIFVYETSGTAEFAALKTGQINVGYLGLSEYDSRKQLTSMGDKISPQYSMGYFDTELDMNSTAPNHLGPVFDKLYVRQAMQMGIN
ncbi:MAG: ABC transporter substrate-binding protein, partial [Firmicutes bacterium]|nr:ABC transporter substrate-binding protein [Bacillota bacterium]